MIVFRRNMEHLNNVTKSTQFLLNRKQKLEDILKQQFLVLYLQFFYTVIIFGIQLNNLVALNRSKLFNQKPKYIWFYFESNFQKTFSTF
jgi:hypothetical protein